MSIFGKFLTVFSALILAWGCSAVSRNGPAAPALPQAVERSVESSAPKPPPVRSLLVTTIDEKLPEPKELISFALKDADIKDVLMGLSRMSRYNIVFEQDISGKLSVDLKEVTLEEALKLLLPPMGLEFKRDGRMIQVSKPKVETRIFTLNYVSTTRKGKNQIQAASGSGGASTGTTGTAAAGATTPSTASGTGAAAGGAGDTSQVESSDQIDQWEEIKQGLAGLVSKEGKFSINRWAGLISVTDFSSNLLKIATYLEAVEGSAQRQVVIEAEVLELSQTEDFEFGIDLVGGSRRDSGDIKHIIQGGGGFASALTRAGIFSQHLNPRTGIINIGLADERLTFLLDLLQKEGKLKVLSRPSVSTLNNQKAIIKVTTDDVFFKAVVTPPNQAGQGQVTNFSPQTVSIGIVLAVTPQISQDGYIIMDVHPSVTEKTGTATSPNNDTAPIVDVRSANTVLRVKDGETIIIAGLMKDKNDRQVKEIPYLSKIPLVGVLFQQIDESKIKTELVIKITPRIVLGSTT